MCTVRKNRRCRIGGPTAALIPVEQSHVVGAERIHVDDATVPALAKDNLRAGRLWTYCATTVRWPGQIGLLPCTSTRRVGAVSIRAALAIVTRPSFPLSLPCRIFSK